MQLGLGREQADNHMLVPASEPRPAQPFAVTTIGTSTVAIIVAITVALPPFAAFDG